MITLYVLLVLAASALGYSDLEQVCDNEFCTLQNNTKFSNKPANEITFLTLLYSSDLEVLKVTPNLEFLQILQCGSDFKMDVFSPMTNLQNIYIDKCSISELQKYQFENVINLDSITLAASSLKVLFNETFHKLSRVTWLKLDDNLITDLPAGVFYPLENLSCLFLRNNNLTILPKDIFLRNTELIALYLDGNPLKIVHLDFPILTPTKILIFDLQNCEELRDLRLSVSVGKLNIRNTGVERFQLTGSIREILHNNSKVTHADLSGTHFQGYYVQVLCDLPSLEWLDLSNSSEGSGYTLGEHGKYCTFPNLQYLNLSGNKLNYLPRRLPLFGPNLTTLDLSHNELEDEEPIFGWNTPEEDEDNFPNLRFVNMSRNKLTRITPRFPLFGTNLTILDLSHNLLEDISLESLAKTQNLESLYLESNQLTSFDYQSVCDSLKNLKHLVLSDNKFNSTFYDNMEKYLRDNGLSAEQGLESEM